MRGNEFLDKMELIDPAYIEAADAVPKAGRKLWPLWRAAVAACICLVLLAGTAAAVSGGGTWLVEIFNGKQIAPDYSESGYRLGASVEKFPLSALSENLREVSDRIVRQYETYQPFSSWAPGHWREKNFSAEEAWAFIGLEQLKKPVWDMEEWYNTLNIYGDSSGKIERILIQTDYRVEDIRLQAWAEIYTENYTGETGAGSVTTEDIEFTETFYDTSSGKTCQIITSTALESGYLMMTGYFVDNGILYSLHAAYQKPDAAQAEELLHQWADMF